MNIDKKIYECLAGGIRQSTWDKMLESDRTDYIEKHPTSKYAEKESKETNRLPDDYIVSEQADYIRDEIVKNLNNGIYSGVLEVSAYNEDTDNEDWLTINWKACIYDCNGRSVLESKEYSQNFKDYMMHEITYPIKDEYMNYEDIEAVIPIQDSLNTFNIDMRDVETFCDENIDEDEETEVTAYYDYEVYLKNDNNEQIYL